MHPVRVVVGRLGHFRHPQLAVEHVAGDVLGARPGVGLGDDVRNAVAGEGELAGIVAVGILVNDAADVVWIKRREHAVHHYLRDRDLAAHRFAARFEIDRVGEALFRFGALGAGEPKPLGRRMRPRVLSGDHAFAGD